MWRDRLRHLALHLLLASLLVLLAGCGGAPPPAGDDNPEPVPTVVNPKVRVLDNYNVQVVDKTENSLTLTGDVPPLQRDDVLVSGKGNGLLRKVVATRRTRSNATVVETVPATLEDVFEQADIRISGAFIPVDVIAENLPEGVTVTPIRKQGRAELEFDFEVKVGSAVLFGKKDDKNDTHKAAIRGTAKLQFALQVEVDIKIRFFRLEHFRFIVTGKTKAEVELVGDIAFWQGKLEKVLWRIPGAPIPAGVPWLVFVPEMKGIMGAEGKVVAGLRLPLHAESTVTGGIEYSEGRWKPIGRVTIAGWYPPGVPVQVFGDLSVEVYKRSELSGKLNDMVGPYIAITLYLDGEWRHVFSEENVVIDLTGGAKLGAGVKADAPFLGKQIAHFELDSIVDVKATVPGFPVKLSGLGEVPVVVQ